MAESARWAVNKAALLPRMVCAKPSKRASKDGSVLLVNTHALHALQAIRAQALILPRFDAQKGRWHQHLAIPVAVLSCLAFTRTKHRVQCDRAKVAAHAPAMVKHWPALQDGFNRARSSPCA